MIGADIVRAVALLSIPLAALAGSVTLPLLYAVATITGVATMLYHLADHVFVTDLVGRKRLLDANGKREAVDAVAEISGPALGGALVAWLTAPIAIAADAATFVVSALLLGRIRKRETIVPPPPSSSFADDVRTGIRVVWHDRAVRALFLATATLSFLHELHGIALHAVCARRPRVEPRATRRHDRLRRPRRPRRRRARRAGRRSLRARAER